MVRLPPVLMALKILVKMFSYETLFEKLISFISYNEQLQNLQAFYRRANQPFPNNQITYVLQYTSKVHHILPCAISLLIYTFLNNGFITSKVFVS